MVCHPVADITDLFSGKSRSCRRGIIRALQVPAQEQSDHGVHHWRNSACGPGCRDPQPGARSVRMTDPRNRGLLRAPNAGEQQIRIIPDTTDSAVADIKDHVRIVTPSSTTSGHISGREPKKLSSAVSRFGAVNVLGPFLARGFFGRLSLL